MTLFIEFNLEDMNEKKITEQSASLGIESIPVP